MTCVKENIEFKNGRYSVDLPRRDTADTVIIPDNYHLSKARLVSLFHHLKRNHPDILQKVDDIFREQEKEGIIEDADDQSMEVGNVHYLPHRPIVRDDKDTSKVRVVFDASAKVKGGISLNDVLEKGPNMLPKILNILLRFRSYRFVLISDIKAAFHQILLKEKSRDLTRFLWFDDIHSENPRIV